MNGPFTRCLIIIVALIKLQLSYRVIITNNNSYQCSDVLKAALLFTQRLFLYNPRIERNEEQENEQMKGDYILVELYDAKNSKNNVYSYLHWQSIVRK